MRRGFFTALLVVLLLALYLCWLAPTFAILAPVVALIVYSGLAHYGLRAVTAADPSIVRAIAVCGSLFALLFVPSILIEYLGRTVNNGILFGAVAACCSVAGGLAAWRSSRVGVAIYASTLSAMIGSLAVVISLLGSYALLRGTALQDRFFRTEGDYADFARSGMTDFNAWVIEDLFGGVFFHLLLGALIAAALGAIAGAIAIGWRRMARVAG